MKKLILILAIVFAFSMMFSACEKEDNEKSGKQGKTVKNDAMKEEKKEEKKPVKIDYNEVKPNEAGKIMVVMFHNFVEKFEAKPGDDGAYTTTFSEFEKLLPELYEKNYRLINMSDYLSNNIDVPPGCTPMIFTLDDATSGQFNLVKKNGKLVANEKSAVGIIEKFNKEHPDFGLKGTFYVNLGTSVFAGEGTVSERLKYLIDKGFEIGNHTYTHINLKQTNDSKKIIEEIGKNNKEMTKLVPKYKMSTFSLPFGAPSDKTLFKHVLEGEYEGTTYKNLAVMEVGWKPALSPVSPEFNPESINRVRASGIKPVQADLAWWLEQPSTEKSGYVSDGNPDDVAVATSDKDKVDKEKLQGKKLVLY
jgi:hypothetical protein